MMDDNNVTSSHHEKPRIQVRRYKFSAFFILTIFLKEASWSWHEIMLTQTILCYLWCKFLKIRGFSDFRLPSFLKVPRLAFIRSHKLTPDQGLLGSAGNSFQPEYCQSGPSKAYRIFDSKKGIEKIKGESLLCTVKKTWWQYALHLSI